MHTTGEVVTCHALAVLWCAGMEGYLPDMDAAFCKKHKHVTHKYTHTHTQTLTHTHTRAHTHKQIHTHTHKMEAYHTSTQVPSEYYVQA